MYLGTWGSLLQSAIRDEEAFGNQYWSGMLHNWMISVPDMAVRCSSDPSILVSFFEKVAMLVPKGKSIALGGGLVRSFRPMIVELVNTYLPQTPILLAPDASTALSASRLGLIGVTRGRHS